mgnify:CR=1 FL=1
MERLVIGMLAHVDAGKTTLSEALLYKAGALRRLGRVDHRDAFLDTHELERERGITIFSKQALMELNGKSITLVDTPGHVDFAAEAERALGILDYAILVISASEGVQTHTLTLWQLLRRHRIPVFLFVNKTDLPSPSRQAVIQSLCQRLDERCVDFTASRAQIDEDVAALCDSITEEYLAKGKLDDRDIAAAVMRRQVFPVYFGSALKLTGVDELIEGIAAFTSMRDYPKDFGARVYKIARQDGQRLTFMKITGGSLAAKQLVTNRSAGVAEEELWQEKADQIRIYSGAKYTSVRLAEAGTVCAVTGLTKTFPGQGLGSEAGENGQDITPVLSYTINFGDGVNLFEAYRKVVALQEEDPLLDIVWDEQHGEIKARLMGEVQCEVLQRLINERYGYSVSFGKGAVMYKETVAVGAHGIGHFEPLRHFAHVELDVEPAEPGSGILIETDVAQDELAKSWQRLILTHLAEKRHKGVLTGAPLTDVRITLTGGKAHQKHTEGGDFRQATYRAVRNALMFAESVLLEPYYDFRLELPEECIGRAMTDIRRMEGEFGAPEGAGGLAVLTGCAPVSAMCDYAKTVASYTKGRGRLSLTPSDYRPCHNAQEVIAKAAYDPEADLKNSPDSVFCAAGAGFTVKWYEVAAYMKRFAPEPGQKMPAKKPASSGGDAELMAIFERTYGPVRSGALLQAKKASGDAAAQNAQAASNEPAGEEFVLVDGYNVIFAWESLRQVARESIDSAREALIRMMINYNGCRDCRLILVFDAYKVNGGVEKVEERGGVYIVYTRESEIADAFIERAVQKLKGSKRQVRVVTSDGLEQLIVMGRGALRVPASAFEKEVQAADKQLSEMMQKLEREGKSVLHLWQKMIANN